MFFTALHEEIRPFATCDGATTATPGSNGAGSVPTYALRQPELFDFRTYLEFLIWRAQFGDSACTASLDQAFNEQRIHLLLYAMGPEARLPLTSFKLCVEKEKSYVKVVEKFGCHFVHPRSSLMSLRSFTDRYSMPTGPYTSSMPNFSVWFSAAASRRWWGRASFEKGLLLAWPTASCQTSCASTPIPHCTMRE